MEMDKYQKERGRGEGIQRGEDARKVVEVADKRRKAGGLQIKGEWMAL